MLEVGEQQAVGWAEGDVAAVDGGEVEGVLVFAPGSDADLAKAAVVEVVAHEVLGEVAPAEAGAEQGVLGVEVADAPGARREDGLIGVAFAVELFAALSVDAFVALAVETSGADAGTRPASSRKAW